ncbi:MAG: M28 family peptidase [Clostridia bacterium]|nr:M28 family peptidase [Clostridia bacterium]
MSYIKDMLFALSGSFASGKVEEAALIAKEELSKYCNIVDSDKNMSFYGEIKGKNDYTLMLDAHIDEVAFTVTDIDEKGFLTVAAVGGIDARTLPAKQVVIHGKKKVNGVFISTPPHLSDGDPDFSDMSKIKVDSCLGTKAKDIISVGDIVTYSAKPVSLFGTRASGKSFDDRAGVVVLIELARRLQSRELDINVVFSVVDGEELGMRGAIPQTFSISPDEAIAVDVTFGISPDVSENEGGYLGKGSMIGVSPVLSREVTDKLNSIAFDENIPYQNEIMGGKTGTDSDVISISGSGVKTGLVSIPLRNMHTDCEVVDIADIEATCDLLEKYILAGGVFVD